VRRRWVVASNIHGKFRNQEEICPLETPPHDFSDGFTDVA